MAFSFVDRYTWGYTVTQLRVQLHDFNVVIAPILIQGVLLIFVYILNPGLITYALIGALVYSMFQMGQRVQNEAAYIRVDSKLPELYLPGPLSPEGYFVGMSLGILGSNAGTFAVLAGILEWTHPLDAAAWLVLAAVLFAVFLFTVSLGYFVSTLFEDDRAIQPYATIITNLFGVLPPVFYPLSLLPTYWGPLALVLPTSAAAALVEAAEGGLVSLSSGGIALAAISLALEATVLFVFTLAWARRSARER
jgi:ABC-2 type transport system permease protein